ncbi:MAG: hypothetical protein S4CHLAM81_10590 [Chlamydiales bacterium]|nr:hypothetical protein [Chlamydiales bacterium]MCH9635837.1 hypothetical protein [Chlamydiales bacterium]
MARAGQISTWKFHYQPATNLPEGTKLKFDLLSEGRDIDWEPPTCNLDEGANVIYGLLNNEIIEGKEIEAPHSSIPQFEFTLPGTVKAGEQVSIVVGTLPDAKPEQYAEAGNECQLTVQRRRPFNLYVDPKGKGNYEEPEVFSMDIRGNKLHHIKVLTPSFVAKNKRFDIVVRFEDEFGNLTSHAPEGTMIDLSYEHLRENLNWKLFVPETGFVTLPNLYFNEAGIYKIQLLNMQTQEKFTSAPIKCFQEGDRSLFWGELHGESERLDSAEDMENLLRHMRDEKAYNFFASSPFEDVDETSNDQWKGLSQNILEFNEEDRFATFLGFQYVGDPKSEGIRQILYLKDSKQILRRKEAKASSLQKLYKCLNPKEAIAVPLFTMGKGYSFDFKAFNPEFERVVEIYNAWGCSEGLKSNPFPIKGKVKEDNSGNIQSALQKNLRFGFVAGGLDDRGIFSDFFENKQTQYSGGLTGIIAPKYSREQIFEALQNRRCYATTGARIIAGFYIAGQPMGSELSTAVKSGLTVNRHISGYVAGTTKLKLVEIIRNGEILHTITPKDEYHIDYFYDDMEDLTKATLNVKGSDPFAYYYLRVTQEDGQMAWSSPIWVDLVKK